MSQQMIDDLSLLEGLGVAVDDTGRAFVFGKVQVPFDAIIHVEVKVSDKTGTVGPGQKDPPGTAWREFTAEVVLVTDDRMVDPRIFAVGCRTFASDGHAPDLDAPLLWSRAGRIAEAAARICAKQVVG